MSRSSRSEPPEPVQLNLFGEPDEPPKTADAERPVPRRVRAKTDAPTPSPSSAPSSAPAQSRDDEVEEPEQRLRRLLEDILSESIVSVTWTQNRTRIVSARAHRTRSGRSVGLDVRIHRCFADASDAVLGAVGFFLASKTRDERTEPLAIIREYFRLHGQSEAAPRAPKLEPVGTHFHLETIRDRINRDYFDGRLHVDITWGRKSTVTQGQRRKRRRGSFSIRLGSYDDRFKLVRIHPVLDRADVPEVVIESIVYHEMLHAVVPPRQGRTRRSVHPPEFRRLEKLFARYEEAEAWLDANIERLSKLR